MSQPSIQLGSVEGVPVAGVRPPKSGRMLAIVAGVLVLIVILAVAGLALVRQGAPIAPGGGGAEDRDGDGVSDATDNCPNNSNPSQTDSDGDGHGDACDSTPYLDSDGDGIPNTADNCPSTWNANQLDSDGDGLGDVCDSTPLPDRDSDGCPDVQDSFPDDPTECRDSDGDGIGDNGDVYDSGDAAVYVEVTYLAVFSDCDTFSACDPYFVIRIDLNQDGSMDCERTSATFQDQNILDPSSSAWLKCNVPERSESMYVCISVFDSDVTGWEWIDYRPQSDGAATCYGMNTGSVYGDSDTGDGSNGYRATMTFQTSVIRW